MPGTLWAVLIHAATRSALRPGGREHRPNPCARLVSMAMADIVSARERVRASIGHPKNIPPTPRVGTRSRDPHGLWLLTITAAVLASVFATAWLLTSVGNYLAPTFAAGAVAVVALIVVITAGWELADGWTARTFRALIATALMTVFILTASWSGALLRLKVQGSEEAWTHAALCAEKDSGSAPCVGVRSRRLNLPSFGRVEKVEMDLSAVIFQGPNDTAGLIYSPDAGEVGFGCVGHISGPWWQYGGNDCSGWPGAMHPTPMP